MKINFKNKITCPVEILRKFSFGIAFTYLITILFGLFLPLTTIFAQETEKFIQLVPDKTTIEKETKIKITASFSKTEYRSSPTTITFFSEPSVEGFNNKANCTIGINEIWSCYVEFKSSATGNYSIYAVHDYFNDKKFKTEKINIQVSGEPIALKPEDKPINTDTTYTPLAPLPDGDADGGLMKTINTQEECAFGKYLNIIIKLIIGISAVLAMVMITMGGIEYLTSELSSEKASGKDTIQNAILGLVMVMGAYLILNTINPQLLNICLDKLPEAKIVISSDDTSTGSETVSPTGVSLCLPKNPIDPNNATAGKLTLNDTRKKEYIPERDKLGIPNGVKLLITAQTAFEGFSSTPPPGTKSYRTKNPGNIGNTDNGAVVTYNTLAEGIKKQQTVVTNVANGSSKSYKIGSKPECALGNETYNGYLYQYLRIYATGARFNNNYLNTVIGYFKENGKTITPKTTITEIYNIK